MTGTLELGMDDLVCMSCLNGEDMGARSQEQPMIDLWVQGTVRHHAASARMTVHACMHGALHANIC